jgi:hypothetical protein
MPKSYVLEVKRGAGHHTDFEFDFATFSRAVSRARALSHTDGIFSTTVHVVESMSVEGVRRAFRLADTGFISRASWIASLAASLEIKRSYTFYPGPDGEEFKSLACGSRLHMWDDLTGSLVPLDRGAAIQKAIMTLQTIATTNAGNIARYGYRIGQVTPFEFLCRLAQLGLASSQWWEAATRWAPTVAGLR